MAVNSTDWSKSSLQSSDWAQPTTTAGTATLYDTAKAYDSAAFYDGTYTTSSIQAVSTNWAIACLVGISFIGFILVAFWIGGFYV